MSINNKCLACGTEDWGGQYYNIEKLGKIYFCDNHYYQDKYYLDIIPPKRYFLAKPLSKKSNGVRFIYDTNHIDEFIIKCKELEEKIPYRYGIYCDHNMTCKDDWINDKNYFDGVIFDEDEDEDDNIIWYWPEEGAENYEYIIHIKIVTD